MNVVILAGGSGTRFWPLSRLRTPKQLISVLGGKSMLQKTVERVLPLNPDRIIVVTNRIQAEDTRLQLNQYGGRCPVEILAEPVGRNTAPAIGLAAALISRREPEAIMVVLPADHFIADEEEFRRLILEAVEVSRDKALVTLGIVPTAPETGYGYIEAERRGEGALPVRRFVEKPNLEKALEFLAAGNFYWNSGMFVWRSETILDRMSEHMPELSASLDRLAAALDSGLDVDSAVAAMYETVPSQSIDYGVMEKASGVVVLPGNFGWNDVGSWSAVFEVVEAEADGNVMINVREQSNIDSSDCVVYGGGKLVALVGVRDLIVVETDDALMVCRRNRAQDVKNVVEDLKKRGLAEYL